MLVCNNDTDPLAPVAIKDIMICPLANTDLAVVAVIKGLRDCCLIESASRFHTSSGLLGKFCLGWWAGQDQVSPLQLNVDGLDGGWQG